MFASLEETRGFSDYNGNASIDESNSLKKDSKAMQGRVYYMRISILQSEMCVINSQANTLHQWKRI